jgi:hypothetical protein
MWGMMKPKKFPTTINGISYKTEKEYDDRLQADINAFAELIYEIYKDKNIKEKPQYAKD